MKKRIDRLLLILLWIIVCALLTYVVPHGEMTEKVERQRNVWSLLLSWIIWNGIISIRNKRLFKPLVKMTQSLDYAGAEKYLKEKIAQYPHLIWMQYQLAFVFALSGQIAEFEAQATSLSNQNNHRHRKYAETLRQIELIVCAIKNKEVTGLPDPKSDGTIEKMANLVLAFDSLDLEMKLREAKTLFSNHAPLIKSLAALYVAKACDENGDLTERDIYMEYALSYAPSEEVKKYLSAYSF